MNKLVTVMIFVLFLGVLAYVQGIPQVPKSMHRPCTPIQYQGHKYLAERCK